MSSSMGNLTNSTHARAVGVPPAADYRRGLAEGEGEGDQVKDADFLAPRHLTCRLGGTWVSGEAGSVVRW